MTCHAQKNALLVLSLNTTCAVHFVGDGGSFDSSSQAKGHDPPVLPVTSVSGFSWSHGDGFNWIQPAITAIYQNTRFIELNKYV